MKKKETTKKSKPIEETIVSTPQTQEEIHRKMMDEQAINLTR